MIMSIKASESGVISHALSAGSILAAGDLIARYVSFLVDCTLIASVLVSTYAYHLSQFEAKGPISR